MLDSAVVKKKMVCRRTVSDGFTHVTPQIVSWEGLGCTVPVAQSGQQRQILRSISGWSHSPPSPSLPLTPPNTLPPSLPAGCNANVLQQHAIWELPDCLHVLADRTALLPSASHKQKPCSLDRQGVCDGCRSCCCEG